MNITSTANTKTPLEKLRAHMKETNLDALVVTNTPDIRWLTGAKNTFDDEQCHIVFITQDEAIVHTDSRYLEALKQNLAYPDAFTLDEKPCLNPLWAAQKIDALAPTAIVAIQDSAPFLFSMSLRRISRTKETNKTKTEHKMKTANMMKAAHKTKAPKRPKKTREKSRTWEPTSPTSEA